MAELQKLAYQRGRRYTCKSAPDAIRALMLIGFKTQIITLVYYPGDRLVLFYYKGDFDRKRLGDKALKVGFEEMGTEAYMSHLWELVSEVFKPFSAGSNVPDHLDFFPGRSSLVHLEHNGDKARIDIRGWLKCSPDDFSRLVRSRGIRAAQKRQRLSGLSCC